MRSTSTNKNAKENFYSKNPTMKNDNFYGSNNSRSPLKVPNLNNNNIPTFAKPNGFQNLMQRKDFNGVISSQNGNLPIKLNGVNNHNTPSKLKENGNNSPNLPMINNNNNGGFNSHNNANHSRFLSGISNNSNVGGNNNTNNSFSNNNYKASYNNVALSNNFSPLNNNINVNNYNSNGSYINNIGSSSISNRNPSAKHNSSSSYNSHAESSVNSKAGANYSNNTNNIINTNKTHLNNSNYINNNNEILDSSSARIRPSSRNQSNSKINNSNNKISENNITTNYTSIKSSYNSSTNLNSYTNNNFNSNTANANSLQIKFDIRSKLVGLKNLGNTCFMNTSLQCILHCEAFITRFLEYCDLKKPIRPTPIANSLLNLIEFYAKSADKSAVSPDELKSAIARKHRVYAGYSQQDSQEFIRKFLDEISQELNLVTERKPYKMLNNNNGPENKKALNAEYDKIFCDRENSIVVDTFYGQSISIFQCSECNFESYSFEKFLDIPLLLEESNSDQQISKLLAKYFESENVQWETPCENKLCRRKVMHRKKLRLSGLPDVLVLSLQRYNNRLRRKNNCKVQFKEEIDLKEFTDAGCLLGKKISLLCFFIF